MLVVLVLCDVLHKKTHDKFWQWYDSYFPLHVWEQERLKLL